MNSHDSHVKFHWIGSFSPCHLKADDNSNPGYNYFWCLPADRSSNSYVDVRKELIFSKITNEVECMRSK